MMNYECFCLVPQLRKRTTQYFCLRSAAKLHLGRFSCDRDRLQFSLSAIGFAAWLIPGCNFCHHQWVTKMIREYSNLIELGFSTVNWGLFFFSEIYVCIRYRDEDGEPLMDFDHIQSDGEQSPEPYNPDELLDEDIGDWAGRQRSQTPVYDAEEPQARPRKRLIKKSLAGKGSVASNLDDDYDDARDFTPDQFVRDGSEERKRKKGISSGKKEKRFKGDKKFGSGSGGKSRLSKKAFSGKGMKDQDGDVKEMWETIAGGGSDVRTLHSPWSVKYYFMMCLWDTVSS